jgi:hypothetical protein
MPVATGIAALAIGIPTDVLSNPWFTRMTPVRTLDVVLWPLTSLGVGARAATFVLPSTRRRRPELGASADGSLLSAFAVGCPVCNKLVVLALGFPGAMTYFAPLQPILGVGALVRTCPAAAAHRRAVRRLRRGPDVVRAGGQVVRRLATARRTSLLLAAGARSRCKGRWTSTCSRRPAAAYMASAPIGRPAPSGCS